MNDAQVIWDDEDEEGSNTAHVAEHGLTPDEVGEVLLDDSIIEQTSQSSGLPCKFGWTSTGKHILVVWTCENENPLIVRPVTAYEVDPPTSRNRRKKRR